MADFDIIARGDDGYYHPRNESEVTALVKYAVANALQIRVRGASHSTAWSIFTDPVGGLPENRTLTRHPPAGSNLDLSLDKINDLQWIDEANGIAEAGAGIHLGADPYNPLGRADLDNSLLFQLFEKGWGVNDLGGITHQTLAGFASTGSSGGSLQHELDNIIGFRVVDGRGDVAWIELGDPEFEAMRVSVGLLGIITRVRLKLNKSFRVVGDEVTTSTDAQCPIDLFGPGTATQPSLQQFLTDTPYSRLLWWPQQGAERVVIWQADRIDTPPPPGFMPVPYQEFAPDLGGWTEQLLGSIFYSLLGNKGFSAVPKLFHGYVRYWHCVTRLWAPKVSAPIAAVGALLVTLIIAVVMAIPELLFILLPGLLARLFPTALGVFQPMTGKDGPTRFDDFYWRSLCMDNTADDILMGTEFTEIWVPIQYTERCMQLMNQMFLDKGEEAVGWFSTEVYGAKPDSAWMSAGYSDGQDEYKDGVVRFDVFWFRANSGEPNVKGGFFQQYWDLFRDNGIPFRLHWGKYVPAYDFPYWAEHYRKQLPKLDAFLELRAKRDPSNIFFTSYWRQRLTGKD